MKGKGMNLNDVFNMTEVENCARQFRELVHDLSYEQQRPSTAIVVALGIIGFRVAAQVVGGPALLRMGRAMSEHILATTEQQMVRPAFVVGLGRMGPPDDDDEEHSGEDPIH